MNKIQLNSIRAAYYKGSLCTVGTGILLIILTLFFTASCATSNANLVRPVLEATRIACRTLQETAIEQAGSRAVAVERVDRVRARCDVAYAGIAASGLLLEEVRHGEE